jgi:4-oxalocrotonate tautomerase
MPSSRWNTQEDSEMPDVHILWLAGRTVDQKRKVVEGITKVLSEEAGAKPESTHIVFVDIPHTDFASNGMIYADKKKP